MTAVILRLSASADFQVRSDIAIRRHQALVNCAFSFCWAAWSAHPPPSPATPPVPGVGGGERGSRPPGSPSRHHAGPGDPGGARLASPADRATALVAGMVQGAPAPAAPGPDDIPRGGPRPAPLHPELANHPIRLPGRPPPRPPPPGATSMGDVTTPATARRHGKGGRTGGPAAPWAVRRAFVRAKSWLLPLDVGEMQDLGFVKRRSTMSNTFRAGFPSRRRR